MKVHLKVKIHLIGIILALGLTASKKFDKSSMFRVFLQNLQLQLNP